MLDLLSNTAHDGSVWGFDSDRPGAACCQLVGYRQSVHRRNMLTDVSKSQGEKTGT